MALWEIADADFYIAGDDMDNQTVLARGMGYVPGIARGVLRRGVPPPGTGIALLTQEQLGSLVLPPAGIIVVDGAPFSHALIALLGLGVPTVLIRAADAAAIRDGLEVVVDGSSGAVLAAAGGMPKEQAKALSPRDGSRLTTRDGVLVELRASVRSVAAAHKALAVGASAIGLVRTEFLVPADGRPPDAEYYAREFEALCAAAAPLSVSFRLLDIAADKLPAWLPALPGSAGAVGMQGVRVFGNIMVAEVVRAQLTAIAQLSRRYPLSVLLPCIARHEELGYWASQLRASLPADIPIGAMVETPAGVLDLDRWFDHADIIAIGCNDLMQYLFAADRNHPELGTYLDPYAPLLYRFFQALAQRVGNRLAQVQLCGVLPQLNGALPILLGLGFRNFSVDAAQVPHLAATVRGLSHASSVTLAHAVCSAGDSRHVLELLNMTSADYRPYLNGAGVMTDQQWRERSA